MNAQEAIEYDENLYGKIRYNEVSYGSQIVYVRQPDAPDTAADLPF